MIGIDRKLDQDTHASVADTPVVFSLFTDNISQQNYVPTPL